MQKSGVRSQKKYGYKQYVRSKHPFILAPGFLLLTPNY